MHHQHTHKSAQRGRSNEKIYIVHKEGSLAAPLMQLTGSCHSQRLYIYLPVCPSVVSLDNKKTCALAHRFLMGPAIVLNEIGEGKKHAGREVGLQFFFSKAIKYEAETERGCAVARAVGTTRHSLIRANSQARTHTYMHAYIDAHSPSRRAALCSCQSPE